jgi:hypothetical protein
LQANWNATLFKCDELHRQNHENITQMHSPAYWVSWADIDFNYENVADLEVVVAQAMIAVTSTNNQPVSYAFGNGSAGTTCDEEVKLSFPTQLPENVAPSVSVYKKHTTHLVDSLYGTYDWPAYAILAVKYLVDLSPEYNETKSLFNITERPQVSNTSPEYYGSMAKTAIHILTGSKAQFARNQADMQDVLDQTGNIPILAILKEPIWDYSYIWKGNSLAIVGRDLVNNDTEQTRYHVVDFTHSPPQKYDLANISTIVKECWGLVSLDPKLGQSWQNFAIPS